MDFSDSVSSLSVSVSLAICLYHPSLPVGLLDYIQFPYRAIVHKFLLVVQQLHVRVKGGIGELLYIDLRSGQTCHSKDGGSSYSIGVGEPGWQYGTGLKSLGTVTNWCTGREWPVNCKTVISTRWRSNMPFQRRRKCISCRVGVNYYITECTGNSISLERRCGREKQHPAEGALGTPDWVLESRRVWRQDMVE